MSDYPEILHDLRDTVSAALTEQGIDAELALACAHSAAEAVRQNWGGQLIYISKGVRHDRGIRDEEIWREFTGNNHADLCRKYDITIQWLYRIIKLQRRKEAKRRQKDIFGD